MVSKGGGKATRVSLVIVSTRSHSSLKASLDAILANDLKDVEIIVVDCCSDEEMSVLVNCYPSVTFLRASEEVCSPLLAGAGLSRASGEIIAVTDTSCLVSSSWVANLVKAHSLRPLVIGGSVEPFGRMNLLDWSAYFCDYGQFMHPLQAGPANVLPGNNISMKRPALAKHAELVSPAFRKTLWCEKLRSVGEQPHCQPAIKTFFAGSVRMVPFLSRRYGNARCFASIRSKEMTRIRRLLYFAGAPLLVVVLLKRTISSILPKRRYRRQLILSAPFLGLAFVVWSLGEALGYLTGSCHGCDRSVTFTLAGRQRSMTAGL